MYTSLLGAAAFMNWRGGPRTSLGIWWFAVGGILGWPFASALCAPFLIEEGILTLVSLIYGERQGFVQAILRVSKGVVSALVLLVSSSTPLNPHV